LEHLAVGGQPRDEAVAVLLHDGAVDVADVDDAGSRILYDGFRLSKAFGFPEELRPSGDRGADDQDCSECDDDGAHGPPRQMNWLRPRKWRSRQDSNLETSASKADALSLELRGQPKNARL